MPGWAKGGFAHVIGLLRVEDEVEERRFMDELRTERPVGEAWSPLLAHEGIEPRPQLAVGRPDLVEDRRQAHLDIAGTVAQGGPRRSDELAELLDRRLAEDGRGVPDEVDPELARDLGHLGRRAEAHQPLLEALRREPPGERLLDDEHDPVAARPQDVADPDAVVGRPEGALGKEHDRATVGHRRLGCHPSRWRGGGLAAWVRAAVTGSRLASASSPARIASCTSRSERS